MMIRTTFVFIFVLLMGHAMAVTIQWDMLVASSDGSWVEANLGRGRSLSLGLEKTSLDSGSYSYAAEYFDLMFAGNWRQAYLGDIVCDGVFANDASDMAYTVSCDDGFVVNVGKSANGRDGEILFLIFKCGWVDEHMNIREPVYGWVEYDIGVNGSLIYRHSAWDLDGGAMIVGGGAIPEPSGGLLVLVGLLALILHRPQEFRSLCC